MTANPPESLGWTSEDWFCQFLIAALAAEGLNTGWYSTHPATAGDLLLGGRPARARLSMRRPRGRAGAAL